MVSRKLGRDFSWDVPTCTTNSASDQAGLRGQPGKPQTTPGPRSQPLSPICEGQRNASDPKGLFGWSVSQCEFPTHGHGFLLTAPVQPVQLELGGGTRGGPLPSQTCPPSPPSGIRTLQGAGESNSWYSCARHFGSRLGKVSQSSGRRAPRIRIGSSTCSRPTPDDVTRRKTGPAS